MLALLFVLSVYHTTLARADDKCILGYAACVAECLGNGDVVTCQEMCQECQEDCPGEPPFPAGPGQCWYCDDGRWPTIDTAVAKLHAINGSTCASDVSEPSLGPVEGGGVGEESELESEPGPGEDDPCDPSEDAECNFAHVWSGHS